LQLRRGGRPQHQSDARRQHQVVGDVPAGLVDPSTARWVVAMPSSRAKVARARAKASVVTRGNRHHQLCPVAGRTKP
jgi:hypothetical protein